MVFQTFCQQFLEMPCSCHKWVLLSLSEMHNISGIPTRKLKQMFFLSVKMMTGVLLILVLRMNQLSNNLWKKFLWIVGWDEQTWMYQNSEVNLINPSCRAKFFQVFLSKEFLLFLLSSLFFPPSTNMIFWSYSRFFVCHSQRMFEIVLIPTWCPCIYVYSIYIYSV